MPSVGRIVHYVSYGTPGREFLPACRAAIITEVSGDQEDIAEGRVGLCVLNPTGIFLNSVTHGTVQDEDRHASGTWHWPERV
jgi:hypothetical protein